MPQFFGRTLNDGRYWVQSINNIKLNAESYINRTNFKHQLF